MASIRGILNIQSLNELTSENEVWVRGGSTTTAGGGRIEREKRAEEGLTLREAPPFAQFVSQVFITTGPERAYSPPHEAPQWRRRISGEASC